MSRQRVDLLQEQKEELLEERAELTQRLEYVESDEYLEQVAREELNLAKPGETVVIVPEGVIEPHLQDEKSGLGEDKRIWEKWVDVVWG